MILKYIHIAGSNTICLLKAHRPFLSLAVGSIIRKTVPYVNSTSWRKYSMWQHPMTTVCYWISHRTPTANKAPKQWSASKNWPSCWVSIPVNRSRKRWSVPSLSRPMHGPKQAAHSKTTPSITEPIMQWTVTLQPPGSVQTPSAPSLSLWTGKPVSASSL